MKKHKWHKEIKAWADGAVIECQDVSTGEWEELEVPYWYESNKYKYRIKSQLEEPQYLYAYERIDNGNIQFSPRLQQAGSAFEYIGKIKLEQDDEQ